MKNLAFILIAISVLLAIFLGNNHQLSGSFEKGYAFTESGELIKESKIESIEIEKEKRKRAKENPGEIVYVSRPKIVGFQMLSFFKMRYKLQREFALVYEDGFRKAKVPPKMYYGPEHFAYFYPFVFLSFLFMFLSNISKKDYFGKSMIFALISILLLSQINFYLAGIMLFAGLFAFVSGIGRYKSKAIYIIFSIIHYTCIVFFLIRLYH